jgi:uncharacterized membrane protein
MNAFLDRVIQNFLRGALLVLPVAGSLYAVWYAVSAVDAAVGHLVPLRLPGLGVVISAVFITAVGALASNVIGRRVVAWLEGLLDDLPLIRLLYASLRDMMHAFVGEQKSLDRPVVVDVGGCQVLGFLTRDTWDQPELAGLVAVYLPQTYNFAGNLILVPADRVRALDLPGADLLQLILSGAMTARPG